MEELLPYALGVIGTLVSAILGVVAWLQREKSKADAALIAELRTSRDHERADRKIAEVRLDSFRSTMDDVTDVLRQAIAFAERVAGVTPGRNRRAGD